MNTIEWAAAVGRPVEDDERPGLIEAFRHDAERQGYTIVVDVEFRETRVHPEFALEHHVVTHLIARARPR